ncbi:putative sulfate transporter 3.3 [Glycine max]|nr:putative sulfate transporter 3.3 [Glycine max]
MFVNKDTSKALAKMSKNDDDISPSLDGLSDKEIGVLNDWENKFQAKYIVIARVLNKSYDNLIGPVSIASLVLGSMLTEEVSPSEQPDPFLQLALTSTFFAGILQAALGILRLGFIIDFLSKAILIGFMAGSAIIVALQQLKGLLGINQTFHQKDGPGLNIKGECRLITSQIDQKQNQSGFAKTFRCTTSLYWLWDKN